MSEYFIEQLISKHAKGITNPGVYLVNPEDFQDMCERTRCTVIHAPDGVMLEAGLNICGRAVTVRAHGGIPRDRFEVVQEAEVTETVNPQSPTVETVMEHILRVMTRSLGRYQAGDVQTLASAYQTLASTRTCRPTGLAICNPIASATIMPPGEGHPLSG